MEDGLGLAAVCVWRVASGWILPFDLVLGWAHSQGRGLGGKNVRRGDRVFELAAKDSALHLGVVQQRWRARTLPSLSACAGNT